MPAHIHESKYSETTSLLKREGTFESQEKYPFSIEMAGSCGFIGGFGSRIFSSARSSSSIRFKDTLAFTTYQLIAS